MFLRIMIAAIALFLSGVPAFAAEHVVDQKDLAFSVDALTVAVGDTIKFTNSDRTTHHIWTSDNGLNVSSPALKPGDSYSVKLVKAGTYTFQCHIHPKMKIVVTVQ